MPASAPLSLISPVSTVIVVSFSHSQDHSFPVCSDRKNLPLHVSWFNIGLHFCHYGLGRESLRSLTPDRFVIKKDANDGEYVEMFISEKTKNHQGGLGDKADESDPKMFSTEMSNCPAKYFKKFLRVLILTKLHCYR